MSLISELKLRIENLPKLQKQKRNNEKVVSLSQLMEDIFNDLAQSINQRRLVLTVFPEADLKKTIDAVKQSKKQADLLYRKLQEDFDEVGANDTNQKVIKVREKNKEAKDQIGKEWKRCVDEEMKFFSPLEEIVRSLPGCEAIVANIASMQNRTTSPPLTLGAAVKFKDDLAQLRVSLGQLKLDGLGGQFLKKAVNGWALAKDLLNKDVQDFLDANGLWDILTIRVGK